MLPAVGLRPAQTAHLHRQYPPSLDPSRQRTLAPTEHGQSTDTIGHIGCGAPNRMWQFLRIHGNMTLDAKYLLAGVISFVLRAGGIRYALRVDDAKHRLAGATTGHTYVVDHIFLVRSPGRSVLVVWIQRSIAGRNHRPYAKVENRLATDARHSPLEHMHDTAQNIVQIMRTRPRLMLQTFQHKIEQCKLLSTDLFICSASP
jgi:hypothetical protein